MSMEKRIKMAERIVEFGHKMEKMMDDTIDQYPDAYYHIVALKYDLNQWQEQVILGCLVRNFTEDKEEFDRNFSAWGDVAREVNYFKDRKVGHDWIPVEELKDYDYSVEWVTVASGYQRIMRELVKMTREEWN